VCSLAGFVVVMLLALLWAHQVDTGGTSEAYVPAQLQHGQVVPAQRAPPP
jgi:hypothetical protein